MTALFVPKTRNRLKNFIINPFKNLNFSKRVFINKTASIKAYLYKAYHTGKGDDFESIAVVVTNPNLPMDCSKMGVFGQQPAPEKTANAARTPANDRRGVTGGPVQDIDKKTHDALWEYGGHFFTFQIDARPDTRPANAQFGKGVFPVQIDYVVIKKPHWKWRDPATKTIRRLADKNPSSKAIIKLFEFKSGPEQRIMAGSEAVQLAKAFRFFKRMYGENNVSFEIYYVPYLATRASIWGPKMPSSPDFPEIKLLTASGLAKLFSIPPEVIDNWGSARALWLKRFETAVNQMIDIVVEHINSLKSNNNRERYLMNLQTKRGPVFNLPTTGGQVTINWRGIMGTLGGSSNLNWKDRHQQLLRAVATREFLKNVISDPTPIPKEQKDEYHALYKNYTKAIVNLNKIASEPSGILTTAKRNKIGSAWSTLSKTASQASRVLRTSMSRTNRPESGRDAEFETWLAARDHVLKKSGTNQFVSASVLGSADVWSPTDTGGPDSMTIRNILSEINAQNNSNSGKKQVSKSKMTTWLKELDEIWKRAAAHPALRDAAEQLILRLQSKNILNNGSGARVPMTAEARAAMQANRRSEELTRSVMASLARRAANSAGREQGGQKRGRGAASASKPAKKAATARAGNNAMAAHLQNQALAQRARTAAAGSEEALLMAAYNRSIAASAKELGLA